MLTYNDIAALVDDGQTAEQIAAALVDSAVTVRAIPLGDLRFYLRDFGLLVRGVDRPFEGGLADLARHPQTPTDLRLGLIDLITHVYDDGKETLSTDTPEIAARGKAMLAALVQSGVMGEPQRDGFYSLGGGLKYAGVTAADVQAVIDAEARRVRFVNAKLAADSAYAAGKIDAEIAAAFAGAMNGD